MYNKLTTIVLFILCTACNHTHNNTSSATASNDSITYNITNNNIEIKFTDSSAHTIYIAYSGQHQHKILSGTYNFMNSQEIRIDVDSVIRCQDNRIELAYKLASNSKLPLVIIADDKYKIDFEYEYFQKHIEKGLYAKLAGGNAACLVKEESIVPKIEDVRKWLYDNNNFMGDSSIDLIYEIYKDLSYKKSNNYCIENGKLIPTIKDFSGIRYQINTNMIADYYYLFATDDKSDLEIFIRDMVSENFTESLPNTNKAFSCYRSKDKGGLLTMFLIGIDKKWNKQIIPIGMVCIDNKPPFITTQSESITDDEYTNRVMRNTAISTNRLSTKNSYTNNRIEPKVKKDSLWNMSNNFESLGFNITRIPNTNIRESITVRGDDFRGNRADFVIYFDQNVKPITFEYKGVKQKLNLTNKKSPYAFSCQLPLNLGDNYIRINAEDKYGNTTESTQKVDDNANLREILTNSIYSSLFYIKMARTGKTTPDININLNNDIDVNVW